jgi:hypothetical protein
MIPENTLQNKENINFRVLGDGHPGAVVRFSYGEQHWNAH